MSDWKKPFAQHSYTSPIFTAKFLTKPSDGEESALKLESSPDNPFHMKSEQIFLYSSYLKALYHSEE